MRGKLYLLAFLPIAALMLAIAAVYFSVESSFSFEPAWLLPTTNILFFTGTGLAVAYVAARSFKIAGRIQTLLPGCSLVTLGLAAAVAGLLRYLPETGANLNVTIFNLGALGAALFQFAAAMIMLTGLSPQIGPALRTAWIIYGYVAAAGVVLLASAASLTGLMPAFFVQGVGPTTIRQIVLGAAVMLFGFAFLVFIGWYWRTKEIFLFWYSWALALMVIGLSAVFFQKSVGSPIGWLGRSSEYLGCVYFLISLITVFRGAQVRGVSMDSIITTSLGPPEEKFRAIAENTPDVIERFDPDLRHVYINQAGARLFGEPPSSIIGKPLEESGLPRHYRDLLTANVQQVFEYRHPIEAEDYLRDGDGEAYYHLRFVPEFDPAGNVTNVLVASRNLTYRKKAEEALRVSEENLKRLNQELERSNQELQQFAYIASHDLQEPLRTVAGFLELLQRRYQDKLDQNANDFIGHAVDGAARMQAMIHDLLEYSRVQTMGTPFIEVSAEEVLSRTLSNLETSIKESGAIITKSDSLPAVWGDRQQLVRLFQNLLSNAIKFRGPDPPRIQISARKQGEEFLFAVKDNGIGIEPQNLDRIFLIFQRLHGRGEYAGTGIGLAICKRIVERHGGRVWAESEPGKGSTFFFTIPVR